MITKWLVHGDLHGEFSRLHYLKYEIPDQTAVICLGDFGGYYYLDKREKRLRDHLNQKKVFIYVVRGNHEQNPKELKNMKLVYDENVQGEVYLDPHQSYIRYFVDGGEYIINNHSVLTLGGAYSVDKEYRRIMGWQWFPHEQLTKEEMEQISQKVFGKHYDIILSHTCPFDWEPVDLFLKQVDQSTVDTSMEEWMNEIKENVSYNLWLFGHFHADRAIRPHVEMFFYNKDELDNIYNRWNKPNYEFEFEYIDPRFEYPDNKWHDEVREWN